jgi:hypothetical protein
VLDKGNLGAVYPLLWEGREWGAGSEEILKTRGLRQDDSRVRHGLISHKVNVIMNLNICRPQSLGGGRFFMSILKILSVGRDHTP